jgi:hypothetical protein
VTALYVPAAGDVPTAAQLATLVPLRGNHTTDQSVTSSTTLVDATGLSVQVAANVSYDVWALLRLSGIPAGSIKVGWVAPAGATFDWFQSGEQSGATTRIDSSFYGALTLSDTAIYPGITGFNTIANPFGQLITAGTAGTFKIQFAQSVSNGTASSILARSVLTLRQTS